MNSVWKFSLTFSSLVLSLIVIQADGGGGGSGTVEVAQLMRINDKIRISRKERDLSSVSHQPQLETINEKVSSGKCRLIRLKIVNSDTDNGSGGGGGGDSTEQIEKATLLKCNGTTNLNITLSHIPTKFLSSIKSIEIRNASVHILNLDEFHVFQSLENLSITDSWISNVIGYPPETLITLNLSSNHLKSIEIDMDTPKKLLSSSLSPKVAYNGLQGRINSSLVGSESSGGSFLLSQLQIIDFSHNKISELPKFIFHLENLKSLRLSGNQLKCEFVWEKMWKWYEMLLDQNVLADPDDTFCGVVDDVRVFHYTILGVLKARKDLEETCGSVDKALCPDCSLYAFQREGYVGLNDSSSADDGSSSISISLKLDCSNRNLTEVPQIPSQTWQLNISNNFIRDLSPLIQPNYSNLLILDADNNQINLDTLSLATPFLHKYNYLSLQNNHFTTIPSHLLSSFKTMRGQGVTFLGGNFIDCDCSAVKEIKPLLIENSKRIKDMKDIYCKDLSTSYTNTFMRVKDLQYADVCDMESGSESSNELYLYLIILVEVGLIILIIVKVWHDQRTFRRTGILPWCSANIPRLPCDAMLESIKQPPNFNRNLLGSANSSNINVNAHSVSHIQLKDIREGSSAHSDKSSISQPSQLSTLPSSSSTTSTV